MKIIECPRDAMQGIAEYIPAESKASYINQLLKIGFDTIDFGSFVSPKAIPQMRDTAKVLEGLNRSSTATRLLAIVANQRGALEAATLEGIDYLGFPLSISETFQIRNTNQTIEQAFATLDSIHTICTNNNMSLVTYLSMGFGNPYDDPYSTDIISSFVARLEEQGLAIISIADTIGVSNPSNIRSLFEVLIDAFPEIEFGAHLHSDPTRVEEKIEAAYLSGCRRFDGALKGYGGCPMAKDELVGNLPTETIIQCLNEFGIDLEFDRKEFQNALTMVPAIFKH